jgi:hypothetical protein
LSSLRLFYGKRYIRNRKETSETNRIKLTNRDGGCTLSGGDNPETTVPPGPGTGSDKGEMAPPSIPQGPEPGENSLAAIVRAAVSSVAAILGTWGSMPSVRTLLDYLGRKLPLWGFLGVAGLIAGGAPGNTLAIGSLVGLFFDTGLAAWHQRRAVPPSPPEGPGAVGGDIVVPAERDQA